MSAVQKYLRHYAEPASHTLAATVEDDYDHALVVPAFDEPAEPLLNIASVCQRSKALPIFVINCHDGATVPAVNATRRLLDVLRGALPNALVVDRVSVPLPRRQGVGLARKLGADIALHLVASGRIRSPWLRQTDADATLPADYFDCVMPDRGAVVFRYRHRADTESIRRAIAAYDEHMALYVAGLAFAGSPYAYPALGSAIAVHAETYAQVRGAPRRNAGEDFYLLNKVAKIAPITQDTRIVIEVAARISDRVPFGTGPSLARISAAMARGETFVSYDPRVFEDVRQTLNAVERFAHTGVIDLPPELFADLTELGWARVATALSTRYPQPAQRLAAANDWFDALKTLRFVHLAERRHPRIPLEAAAEGAPFSWRRPAEDVESVKDGV